MERGKRRGYNMRKIGKTIGGVVFLIIFSRIIMLFVPALKESMCFLRNTIWTVFREFFLWDVVKEYGIYIGLFIIASIICGYVGRKTENFLWNIVSLICVIGGIFIKEHK